MLIIIIIILGILLTIFLILGIYCCCKVSSLEEQRDNLMYKYLEDTLLKQSEKEKEKDE